MPRLASVRASTRRDKKMMAVFETRDGHAKTVHFGARGCGDFPAYYKLDPVMAAAKRRAYIARHRVRENWADPTTPGALSRFILWEKPTATASIAAFRRRFRLTRARRS